MLHAHHDLGGMPGGPIDRKEYNFAEWEKRTHALLLLLARPRGSERPLVTVDEMRRGIESLGEREYARMSYYERWIASITDNLIKKGVLTVDELGRKLAEVEAREELP